MNDVVRVMAELDAWQERGGPRYRQLADALAAALDRGALEGMRLPAERRLAERLGVSRSTVVRAYAVLRERGLVTSRQRSATTARATGRRAAAPGTLIPALNHISDGPAGPIDLAVGGPSLDATIGSIVAGLADAASLVGVHGYAPKGLPALRQAIADLFSRRGAPTTADEILVTSGAQEAISLVARLLIGRDHAVVVDSPTYSGALDAFERAGGRIVPVASDVAGMRGDALRNALEHGPVSLMYLLPNCHNPTGGRIAAGRRQQLLDLAREYDVPVVEDQTLDEMSYDGQVTPTLQALAPDQVIAVGSLSKVAWGGLRVGWVRAPRSLIVPLGALKASWDLGAPALDQVVALRLLAEYDDLSQRRRREARDRMSICVRALRASIPEWQVEEPLGGFSVWIRLPHGSGDELAAAARRHGVLVWPGSASAPAGECGDCVRICFGASEAEIQEGIRRLAFAWRELAIAAPELRVTAGG